MMTKQFCRRLTCALLALGVTSAFAGSEKKPVKVYILAGQSNMVGFGTLKGAVPAYPSIYLSADPSIMPCKMPVGSSGLLPFRVYQEATGDASGAKAAVYAGAFDAKADYSKLTPAKESTIALGKVTEALPSIPGAHCVVVKGFIEVPLSGNHEVHAGFGESSQAVVSIDGQEVYRREGSALPVITQIKLEKGRRYPVTVIFQQGGSASFWMELVDLKGKGDLEAFIKSSGLFRELMDEKGTWTVRDDVIYNDAYLGKGRSVPLSAAANGKYLGPEVGFGWAVGNFLEEPVLLIKSCTGNRSLGYDYLPPGSERFEATVKDEKTGIEKRYVFAGYKDFQERWEKGTEPVNGGWYAGKQYDDSTEAIHKVLDNFDTIYPQFKERGYEVAGFVWWQGHKDQDPIHAGRYEQNLVNLIKAWRKEFKAPEAKWVIGTIGFGGWRLAEPGLTIANAQLAVSGDTGKYPEFKGNVKTIEARGFWRDMAESPSPTGYHYNHNGETYMLVGDALGKAMVEMLGGKTQPLPPGYDRPPRPVKPWSKTPTLEEAVEMLYSDAFLMWWLDDPAEPTPAQFEAMSMALRPIILDKIVPEFPAQTAKTPEHLHRGIYLAPLITGKKPANIGAELTSDLDQIASFYKTAGIHEYGWQRFGPEMQQATWEYFSFDPAEQPEKDKTIRYRTITYPEGMTNWFAVDFDAKKAGWKSGQAPFGQNDGKLEALSSKCTNPECGCGTAPKTLWEKEVLLMRQTFEIPKLKEGYRYRLVVGGSRHLYAGEGFALYVNGKLFSEAKTGYYKKGGDPRGGFVFSDFQPEFQTGKITIAVKSFLRMTGARDKPSPPRGHISVWMEEMKIPEPILKAF